MQVTKNDHGSTVVGHEVGLSFCPKIEKIRAIKWDAIFAQTEKLPLFSRCHYFMKNRTLIS